MRKNRCYIVAGKGVYIAAYVLVFATDMETARKEAHIILLRKYNTLEELEVREVPMQGTHVIADGDY